MHKNGTAAKTVSVESRKCLQCEGYIYSTLVPFIMIVIMIFVMVLIILVQI